MDVSREINMGMNQNTSKENSQHAASPKSRERYSAPFVYLMTFGVTIGSFASGYNQAILSGAMLYVRPHFQLDSRWEELIVSMAVISAAISSIITGPITDKLGRRPALLMTAVMSIAGPAILAAAPNKEVLLAGRIVTGSTFALALSCSLVYLAEMSPAAIRGRLVTIEQLQANTGVLLSALVSGAFSFVKHDNWRYMLGFSVIPALLFGVAMLFLPETPRWLMRNGRQQEAERVLRRVYGHNDVTRELAQIQESIDSETSASPWSVLKEVVTTPHVLRALALGICLGQIFAWSGINTVLYYCGTIIQMVGFPVQYAVWVQGLIPLAMFIGTFPSIMAVERCGRRPIALTCLGGSAVSLLIVSIGFHLTTANVPQLLTFYVTDQSNSTLLSTCAAYRSCADCVADASCGLCSSGMEGLCVPASNQWDSTLGPCDDVSQAMNDTLTFALDYCPSPYIWVVAAGLFFSCFTYSADRSLSCRHGSGISGGTWAINAEIYPSWARSTCSSMVVALYWMSEDVISFYFLSIIDTLKAYGTFWLFTGMCVAGVVVLATFLPKTKNRILEDMEVLFMTPQQVEQHQNEKTSSHVTASSTGQEKANGDREQTTRCV